MKAYQKYIEGISAIIKKIEETQNEAVMKAANLLADVTQNNGIIYGFGTGHSHLVVEDAFWRAASPANYAAIIEPSSTGTFEITKSYLMENLPFTLIKFPVSEFLMARLLLCKRETIS